jgi:hypothetical protein
MTRLTNLYNRIGRSEILGHIKVIVSSGIRYYVVYLLLEKPTKRNVSNIVKYERGLRREVKVKFHGQAIKNSGLPEKGNFGGNGGIVVPNRGKGPRNLVINKRQLSGTPQFIKSSENNKSSNLNKHKGLSQLMSNPELLIAA